MKVLLVSTVKWPCSLPSTYLSLYCCLVIELPVDFLLRVLNYRH